MYAGRDTPRTGWGRRRLPYAGPSAPPEAFVFDLTPDRIIAIVIVITIMLLVAFPIHEYAHAWAANRLGDGTARMFGRMTIDPRVHFDRAGGTLLALSFFLSGGTFGFGWAKPTPVNPSNLSGGPRGEAMVAAAGPLSNLALAAVAAIPFRFLLANPDLQNLSTMGYAIVFQVLALFILINLLLMIFNLLPIPPLDGSKVLFAFLPPRTAWQVRPFLERYGFFVLIALVFLPPANPILFRVVRPILDAFFAILVGR
jgi:Zn-dependent protease